MNRPRPRFAYWHDVIVELDRRDRGLYDVLRPRLLELAKERMKERRKAAPALKATAALHDACMSEVLQALLWAVNHAASNGWRQAPDPAWIFSGDRDDRLRLLAWAIVATLEAK